MLVAKKGENEDDDSRTLEYFNEVVINMTLRISDILVKLASSACSLFNHFNIKLFCDIEGKRVRSIAGTFDLTSLVRKAVDMLGLKSLEKIVDFCVRNDGFYEDE